MTIVYTKPQVDATAVKIGGEIKKVRSAIPTVTQQTGQSTTQVVSQKLFTDTIDGKTISSIVINSDQSITITNSDSTASVSNVAPTTTGWGAYKDGQYGAGSPFAVAVSSELVLPNNAVVNIESMPSGISTFYDEVSQKYLLTDLNGLYSVRVKFKAAAASTAGFVNISMSKGTTEVAFSEDRALRGDNVIQDLNFSAELYGDSTLSTDGLTINVKTFSRAISIYDIEVIVAKVI